MEQLVEEGNSNPIKTNQQTELRKDLMTVLLQGITHIRTLYE